MFLLQFYPSLQSDRIENDGYPAQVHKVVTSDGYILRLHRIGNDTSLSTEDVSRVPVFLMHGLLETASSWIALGPEHSLGTNEMKHTNLYIFNRHAFSKCDILFCLFYYMQQLIYCTIMATMCGWAMHAVHDHHRNICT